MKWETILNPMPAIGILELKTDEINPMKFLNVETTPST